MKLATILAGLPPPSGWYFGGSGYGLEPLTLPHPDGSDDGPGDPASRYDYGEACLRILQSGASAETAGNTSANELFWFRWVTGHQVSFIIWRLMAQTLHEMRAGQLAQPAAVESLCDYVRGYCTMLLYTSSCTRDVYENLIRPSMYLQHRGFSGSWAPDYRPVRDVFHGRLRADCGSGHLSRAVELCSAVHDGVAAKLVPSGSSLLQESVKGRRLADARLPDMQVRGALFDNYFLTLRGRVSLPDIVAQLLRRLVAISQDVAVNGLHPFAAGAEDRPRELRSAAILDCEDGFAVNNFRVARCAVGLVAGDGCGVRLSVCQMG
jgi:hypothetical protein